MDVGFLLLLAIAAAGTSQVTGSLLVFALLVAPAATATRLTARPVTGIALSVGPALAIGGIRRRRSHPSGVPGRRPAASIMGRSRPVDVDHGEMVTPEIIGRH